MLQILWLLSVIISIPSSQGMVSVISGEFRYLFIFCFWTYQV